MSNTANIRARQRAMGIYRPDPNDPNSVVDYSGNCLTRREASFLGASVIEDDRVERRSEADAIAKAQEREAFQKEVLASPEAKARPQLAKDFLADPTISEASAEMVIKQLRLHRTDADKEWAKQVLASPEAKDRPKSARDIVERYGHTTLPLDRARAFLRGLPLETSAPDGGLAERFAMEEAQHQSDKKTLQRKLEIRAAALHVRADRGEEAARKELRDLEYAFRVSRETKMSLGVALQALGIKI